MFHKLLIANRGEIARRVAHTCRRLGIETVAVFSEADRNAPFVREADSAVAIGPAEARQSYLNIDAVVAAIEASGADAVHPGYGFLSENAAFARAVATAGATFIGPSPHALGLFGDKVRARELARSAGASPPPGIEAALSGDFELAERLADSLGYPLLVKVAAGGGGIGMEIVRVSDDLKRALEKCASRGAAAFSDPRVYMERYIVGARHVEVQVLRDTEGNTVVLGERECSVQRRHQKVIEETPCAAPFFSGDAGARRRAALWDDARRIVDAADYEGAGTVEFVLEPEGTAYFLEVNARLQVEHPVTEAVTGLDLVELQLRIAAGEALPEAALRPRFDGHAIEARVYAEDPSRGFLPQPGRLERVHFPDTVRVDSGVEAGMDVTPDYDPLLAKLTAHAATREQAVAKLEAALDATELVLVGKSGPRRTNLDALLAVLRTPAFQNAQYDTELLASLY